MDEQTLFNQYLSGEITFSQYIGKVKLLQNEKSIQDQAGQTQTGYKRVPKSEEFFTQEDNLFI